MADKAVEVEQPVQPAPTDLATPGVGRNVFTPGRRGGYPRFRGSGRQAWLQRRREADYLSVYRQTLLAITGRPFYPRRRPWQVSRDL